MLSEVPVLTNAGLLNEEIVSDVLARARAGDPDAFHAVFDRFAKPVLSFTYSLIGNRAVAEELTQETFVRVHRRLASLHSDAQLSTWIFGIARNVVRESYRKKYRRQQRVVLEEGESVDLEDSASRPDERLIAEELQRTIRSALARLPADHRLVFVLKVINRMNYREIASITGSSVGKLKTDLHRARLEMRQRLLPYVGKEPAGMRGET